MYSSLAPLPSSDNPFFSSSSDFVYVSTPLASTLETPALDMQMDVYVTSSNAHHADVGQHAPHVTDMESTDDMHRKMVYLLWRMLPWMNLFCNRIHWILVLL